MIELNNLIPKNKKRSSNISVIGVGGGGSNAVDYMYGLGIRDVEFIVCNTDLQALNSKKVPRKIMIGTGLGAGADPMVAEKYAEDDSDKIRNAIEEQNTKMIFITAGMGGGTGTGAAPVIARIARSMGILAVGIVTMPLKSEGNERMRRAKEGLLKLKENLDAILIIDNTMVLKLYDDLTWKEAFHKADDILAMGAQSLAEVLIKDDYHLNVDYNDVSKTMKNTGLFLMGTATAKSSSEHVVDELVSNTLQSPLLMQNDIRGAKNVLLSLTNGKNGFKARRTEELLERIQSMTDDSAEIITALGTDENLAPDEVKLIIIAAGFDSTKRFNGYNINTDINERSRVSSLSGYDNDAALGNFESKPAYKRADREMFHHIDPAKQKIVKLVIEED